jgi:hypothetical protein
LPVTPAGIPVAFLYTSEKEDGIRTKWTCHVTVCTSPTFQIDCAVGDVIGGSNTVRLSKGAARITEKNRKRHRVIRWGMIEDSLNQPTLMQRGREAQTATSWNIA